MDNRTRAGIADIVVGCLIVAFFLFGLGAAWLVPAVLADPGTLIEMLRRFSAGDLVLLAFVAFLFFLGLFMIYRGVSILAGWRFLDTARAFFHQAKGLKNDTNRTDTSAGRPGTNGEP